MSEEGVLKQAPTRLSKVSLLRNMFQNGNPSPAEELGVENAMIDGEEILLAKNSIIRFVENQTYKKMTSNGSLGKPMKPPKPSKLTYSKKLMKKTEDIPVTESVKNDYFFRANRNNIPDSNSSSENQLYGSNVNIDNNSKIEFIVKKDYISTANSNPEDKNGYLRAETVHIENTTPDSEDSYGYDSGINNPTKNLNAHSILSINNNSSGTVASGQSTTDYFSNEIQREDTFFTNESNVLNNESVFSSRSSTKDSHQLRGSNENDLSIKPILPIPLPSALNVVGVYEDGSYALENGHYFYQVPGIPQVLDEADEDAENDEKSDQIKVSKNVHFSLSPITIFSTYSKADYDRRNNEIDPITATMEWEFEKKLERMKLVRLELNKGRSGFGFNIVGVPLTDNENEDRLGIYIKAITPGGAAEKDGRLRVEDQIIEVNGHSLVGVTHQFSSKVLRNATGTVKLVVGREKSENEPDERITDQKSANEETNQLQNNSRIPDTQREEKDAKKSEPVVEGLAHEDSVERLRKILAEASATAAKAHANRLAEDDEDEENEEDIDDNYIDNNNHDNKPSRDENKTHHSPHRIKCPRDDPNNPDDNRNDFHGNRESTTLDPEGISKEMENLNELERQLDRQLELSFGKNLPTNHDQMMQSSEDPLDGNPGDDCDDEELDEELDAYLYNPKEYCLSPSSILTSCISYIATLTCPPSQEDPFTAELNVPKSIVEMALMEGRLVLSKSFIQQLSKAFEGEPSLKDEGNVIAALFFLSTALYQKHLTIIGKHRRIRNLGEKLSSHEAAADEAIERLCLRCHSLEVRLKAQLSNSENKKPSVEAITNTEEVLISSKDYQSQLSANSALAKKIEEMQEAYQATLTREKELQQRLVEFMDSAREQKTFYEKLVSDANEKIKNLETKLAENFTNTQNGMSKLTA